MNDLRKYLKILEDVTDLLSFLPESYNDIIYLIDKMYHKLEIEEGKEVAKNERRNAKNI